MSTSGSEVSGTLSNCSTLQILSSLRVLLTLPPMDTPVKLLRQISNGLHEIVQSNSGHISSTSDWSILIAVMEACSTGARHLPRLMSDGPTPFRDSPASKGAETADSVHVASSESEMSAISRITELDQFLSTLKTSQQFSSLPRPKSRRAPTTLTCGRLKHLNGMTPSRCLSPARRWHCLFETSDGFHKRILRVASTL